MSNPSLDISGTWIRVRSTHSSSLIQHVRCLIGLSVIAYSALSFRRESTKCDRASGDNVLMRQASLAVDREPRQCATRLPRWPVEQDRFRGERSAELSR